MRVLMFQPRFHERIRSGVKRSTIRLEARCKPGDDLSLRAWLGRPYHSKQTLLWPKTVTCTKVTEVTLAIGSHARLELLIQDPHTKRWTCPDDERMAEIAAHEGFDSREDMSDWFIMNHDLPRGRSVKASLIEWEAQDAH